MSFHVIIPARFESSRLPGKPLKMIGHLTMIEHVCQRAIESGALSVTVATDHLAIKSKVEQAGFKAVLTREDHVSGSDRIFEAANKIKLNDEDIIVNVQGDEPFIPSKNIRLVAKLIERHKAKMTTLCCPIKNRNEVNDANSVKVIFDNNNKAIYFSRSAIPFNRSKTKQENLSISNYFRHIGIYAYKKSFLAQFVAWPESFLESTEKLEQLRVLENGGEIYLDQLKETPPAGIDTPEDLIQANIYFQSISK